MIVKKVWTSHVKWRGDWVREGWFLLGLLPLYVRDVTPRP